MRPRHLPTIPYKGFSLVKINILSFKKPRKPRKLILLLISKVLFCRSDVGMIGKIQQLDTNIRYCSHPINFNLLPSVQGEGFAEVGEGPGLG
jgi:hypothetical protein